MIADRELVQSGLQSLIARSDAEETEVTLAGGRMLLSRVVDNLIARCVEVESYELTARLAYRRQAGWHVGVARSTGFDPDRGAALIDRARETSFVVEPQRDYVEMPWPAEFESFLPDVDAAYRQTTATFSPTRQADTISRLVLPSLRLGYSLDGYLATSEGSLTPSRTAELTSVANSKALFQHFASTRAVLKARLRTPDGGLAEVEHIAHDVEQIDLDGVREQLLARAQLPRMGMPAGRFPAVLEPDAVAAVLTILEPHLSWHEVSQGYSAFSASFGRDPAQPVFADTVSLADDPLHPLRVGRPFDGEGWPRRRVVLVDRGALMAFAMTRSEALSQGLPVPGQTPPAFSPPGARPQSLVMTGGDTPLADLVGGVPMGLLIGHITRIGPSRPYTLETDAHCAHSAYLIERGRVIAALPEVRLRLDVGQLLRGVRGLGEVRRAGSAVVPSLLVESVTVV